MKNLVVVGALSKICEEVILEAVKNKVPVFLVARNAERLQAFEDHLRALGGTVLGHFVQDFASQDPADYERCVEACWAGTGGEIDTVLLGHGVLTLGKDWASIHQTVQVNVTSKMMLLQLFADKMLGQGKGQLAVIGSVAGDRGRKSNYLYGSSKAAINTFTDGLRNALFHKGITVLTIKPGFVETPMTDGVESKLMVSARSCGQQIYRRLEKRSGGIQYVPRFWQGIMFVVKAIPDWLFKRLSI